MSLGGERGDERDAGGKRGPVVHVLRRGPGPGVALCGASLIDWSSGDNWVAFNDPVRDKVTCRSCLAFVPVSP